MFINFKLRNNSRVFLTFLTNNNTNILDLYIKFSTIIKQKSKS